MRSRILFFSLIGLSAIIIVSFWLSSPADDQGPIQALPGTVSRDCAPWDGAAFTVSIQYDPDSVIDISIWRSPDIRGPIKFSFPDSTRSIGDAILLQNAGLPEEMRGSVHFQSAEQGIPVEGEFNLTAATGKQFKGKFLAGWGNEIVYCG